MSRRIVALPPLAPTALIGIPTVTLSTIVVGTSEIDLTASYTGPPTALTYSFYSSTTGSGPWTLLATQSGATYSHTGLSAVQTVYYYATVQTNEGPSRTGMPSAIVSAVTSSTGAAVWTAPTPSYVSQIPNAAGFGMDSVFGSGRHLGTPATTVYLVNTLSSSSVGPTSAGTRVYTCSMTAALAAAGPKVIIPIISGNWNASSLPNLQNAQYCTFAGQIAPSPGFIGINGLINNRGSDALYWHWTNYINPATNSNLDDLGDSLAIGGYNTNSGSRNVAANCSLYGATDETLQIYCIGSNYTIWQCHIGNPTSVSGRDRATPHGTGIISADDAQNVSILRTIIQHCNFRMPFARARSLTVANCLMYDAGPTSVTTQTQFGSWTVLSTPGESNQSLQSPGTTFQSFVNFEENLYVMGPSPASSAQVQTKPINLSSGSLAVAFPAGSQGYFSGNRVRDRNSAQGQGSTIFANGNSSTPQSQIIAETAGKLPPSGYYATSRITSVYPTGYNTYTITDTEAGKLDYASLLAETVGARPLDRAGWDTFSPYQAKNYINGLTGNTNIGHVIDAVASTGTITSAIYGGYPSLASNLVDVFDSAAMSSDPLITVEAGRDVVQASGLTWLEEWLQRWHLRRATY
jgi:hypothetical protein